MANESHHSMEEIEPVHKVSNKEFEGKTRAKEATHRAAAALANAHEKAAVPSDVKASNRSNEKSVGHYLEHDGKHGGMPKGKLRIFRGE